ncbi:hypothetical protein HYALB_00007590 [Hymenoscyphus albidus]|uniref:Uncharacterized protein n=1 Tax=Hymenoscyphus albidus TaxID=595503 RepID=A0A9N9LG43_9HELO|nr:hypothetical protein HYALB_00007590 [Hymenoscyphus albidus]
MPKTERSDRVELTLEQFNKWSLKGSIYVGWLSEDRNIRVGATLLSGSDGEGHLEYHILYRKPANPSHDKYVRDLLLDRQDEGKLCVDSLDVILDPRVFPGHKSSLRNLTKRAQDKLVVEFLIGRFSLEFGDEAVPRLYPPSPDLEQQVLIQNDKISKLIIELVNLEYRFRYVEEIVKDLEDTR